MLSKSTTSVLESVSSMKNMTKDFCSRTRDLSSKDKDCIVKDQDKDCILVPKESLRTRTNITAIFSYNTKHKECTGVFTMVFSYTDDEISTHVVLIVTVESTTLY